MDSLLYGREKREIRQWRTQTTWDWVSEINITNEGQSKTKPKMRNLYFKKGGERTCILQKCQVTKDKVYGTVSDQEAEETLQTNIRPDPGLYPIQEGKNTPKTLLSQLTKLEYRW